jgi:hypothetical protein
MMPQATPISRKLSPSIGKAVRFTSPAADWQATREGHQSDRHTVGLMIVGERVIPLGPVVLLAAKHQHGELRLVGAALQHRVRPRLPPGRLMPCIGWSIRCSP